MAVTIPACFSETFVTIFLDTSQIRTSIVFPSATILPSCEIAIVNGSRFGSLIVKTLEALPIFQTETSLPLSTTTLFPSRATPNRSTSAGLIPFSSLGFPTKSQMHKSFLLASTNRFAPGTNWAPLKFSHLVVATSFCVFVSIISMLSPDQKAKYLQSDEMP